MAKKREEQANRAPTSPVFGTVQATAIVDTHGQTVFQTFHDPAQPDGDAAARTLEVLSRLLGTSLVQLDAYRDISVQLFGFDIHDRLRLMVLDAMRYHVVMRTQMDIPVGLWYHKPFEPSPWADPFEVLIRSEQREKDVDRAALCDFLGVACPDDLEEDPLVQATTARALAIRAQLFPHTEG